MQEPTKRTTGEWVGLLVWSLLLTLPVLALYASQYLLSSPGEVYTGFIQGAMANYTAYAHQYVENPGSLLYSNAYAWDPAAPRIYFQPLIWLLGQFMRTGVDPAIAFVSVGIVATIASMAILQILLRGYQRTDRRPRNGILILAAWGGGVLTLGSLVSGRSLDPAFGLWCLNLGRNFIYSTEAVYHLLTLALFWSVLRSRFWPIFGLGLALAISHPFTGAQYAAILFAWAAVERFTDPDGIRPAWVIALGLPLVFVIAYYLAYLPSFPAHRAVMEQWSLDWPLTWTTSLAAYGPVAALAAHRLLTDAGSVGHFERFLIVAALVSFGLANHDLLLEPRQPLHFTRGHIWFPLFLLGLPSLVRLVRYMEARFSRRVAFYVLFLIVSVGLVDNASFFLLRSQNPTGIFLSEADDELLRYVEGRGGSPVVLTPDPNSTYLLPSYTPARPFVGQWVSTPDIEAKRRQTAVLFEDGVVPAELEGQCLLVAVPRHMERPPVFGGSWRVRRTSHWTLLERDGFGCRADRNSNAD